MASPRGGQSHLIMSARLGVARRSAGAALRPHARAFSSKVREKGKGEEADFFRKQEREQLAKMNSAKSKPVERVGVIGLGLMGHGIAQVAAERGFEVVAVDLEQRFLDGGMKRVEGSVRKLAARAAKKGKMSEQEASAQAEASLGRITPTTDLGALAECDAVIEAVIEDLALKEKLYATIGATVSNTCIIASNTSSLPITKMGAFSGRSAQAPTPTPRKSKREKLNRPACADGRDALLQPGAAHEARRGYPHGTY